MKRAGMIFVMAFGLTVAAAAQMEAPKPGPELKKLDVFAGSWMLDANLKPSSMGPGGTVTETEKCEWREGGFYLVCHLDYKGPTGNGVGTSFMGYSADDKAYTYREFNSYGEFTDARGTIDGDTWTWTSEYKMGGMAMKGKFTVKVTSATSYNFAYEMSQDGAKWNSIMEGKATKK